MKASASTHKPARTAPVLTPSTRASSYRSRPRLPTIDTVTYGRTVICSSLTKPSAAHRKIAARSPRNSPTTTPVARPTRIRLEKDMRRQLPDGARMPPPGNSPRRRFQGCPETGVTSVYRWPSWPSRNAVTPRPAGRQPCPQRRAAGPQRAIFRAFPPSSPAPGSGMHVASEADAVRSPFVRLFQTEVLHA